MRPLLFAPETLNFSETQRMLDIARHCRERFDPVFLSYGGKFHSEIEKAGFTVRRQDPPLTPEVEAHMLAVDQGDTMGDLFPDDTMLERRIDGELALLRELAPAAVVTGFCFSAVCSARLAGVPVVWVLAAAGVRPYFDAGLGTWPDALDAPWLRWLPERWMNRLANVYMRRADFIVKQLDRVGKARGMRPMRRFLDALEGDRTLLTDIPTMTGIDPLPEPYEYVGPMVARLDGPIPPEVQDMPRDLPIVYFAMGSSGQPDFVQRIVEGFGGRRYRVIAPVAGLLVGRDVAVPSNVIVTGWLPAHRVNPMADLSVIHGGQGTVYTACLAGTPVVGVGFQPEQEGNLECLVRHGFAIRLRKRRLTVDAVLTAVDRLLADPVARERAVRFQQALQGWDGASNAAQALIERYGG